MAVSGAFDAPRFERFFSEMRSDFGRACGAAPPISVTSVIAGTTIRQHFAGAALLEHGSRALQHLRADGERARDLDVYYWDSASTGIEAPRAPNPPDAFARKGAIAALNDERHHAQYAWGVGAAQFMDQEQRAAVYWIDDARQVPYWEASFPMRQFLHWHWLASRKQLFHAGAVAWRGVGLLVTGLSGSGKSTTCLACVERGFDYLGDDYVAVEPGPPAVVHSVYQTAKLDVRSLRFFPQWRAHVRNPGRASSEKALLHMSDVAPNCLRAQVRLGAIVLPRITGDARTSHSRASGAEALLALSPTTVAHLQGGEAKVFTLASALVRQLPAFHLNLGRTIDSTAPCLAQLCEELCG